MIPSLLSALFGSSTPLQPGRAEASPPEAPEPSGEDFVSALLRAFGTAGPVEADPSPVKGSFAAPGSPLSGTLEGTLLAAPSAVGGTGDSFGSSGLDAVADRLGTDGPERTDTGSAEELRRTDARTMSSDAANDALALSPLPTDVSMADRSWERLDPDLRSRLETVVHRMDAEYGHDVRLIEGYRSPDRQSHLFEQGRSRPGPVVTWTLDSAHLAGRAVDVQVDGSFDVTPGYSRLQQVAAEEGLRTLGMRDPGHLELSSLPRGMAQVSQEAPARVQEARQVIAPQALGGIARPAQVAGIARVAQVARIAQLARVARPGQGRVDATGSAATTEAPPDSATPSGTAPLVIPDLAPRQPLSPVRLGLTFADAGGGALPGDNARSDAGSGLGTDAGQASSDGNADLGAEARLAAIDILAAGTDGAVSRAAPVSSSGLDTMSRVESVLHARELAGTALPGRVSVRLEGTGGSMDQMRVDLFGRVVEADLDVADAETAALIRSRVSELHNALETRGLELGSLGVATSGAELSVDPLFGARTDATTDLLRSLLGTTAGDTSRDSSGRERWEQQRTNDDGTDSDRPHREPAKEE